MNNNIKRALWTVSKGKSIGFIECLGQVGIIHYGNYFSFRETSSQFSSQKPCLFNTRFLSLKEHGRLESFMVHKKPLCIHYKQELFNNPLRGQWLGELYATHIDELQEEIIAIKVGEPSIEK